MTTLIAAELLDLKVDLDIADVLNDVRVLLPSYSYTLVLVGAIWYKIPIDVSQCYTDGASINNYGRRTKIYNRHVIDSSFSEEFCHVKTDASKDPCNRVDMNMAGQTDAEMALILDLATKPNAQVSYLHAATGLNDTGVIESLDLDIDLDLIPRLKTTVREVKALDLLDWFTVGVSLVGGPDVVG